MQPIFGTSREKLAKEYADSRKDFTAFTKPYKSTGQLVFDVVDPLPGGAATVAYAVLRAGRKIEFFSYGVGDAIPYGFNATRGALESDTTLSKARRTNGVEDVCIEGISVTCKGLRVEYAPAAFTGVDQSVKNAHVGTATLGDPGALAMPPQMDSPFNLENPMFEKVKPCLAIEFEWDRQRVMKIGTCDEIPEGGAKSFLKSSGDPRTDNRYKIPEGYLWRQQGRPDSEFIARATVVEDVVIPISLVGLNGQAAVLSTPLRLYLDLSMRLHGLVLGLPSNN